MRKKTILSIGGLTLAAGLGVAAIGGAVLPLAFSAVTTGSTTTVEKVLEVVETTPKTGSTVALWQLPAKFQVQFTAPGSAGTWDGLTGLNPECTDSIEVGKATGDAMGPNTYYTKWKKVGPEAVSINKNNPNIAEIDAAMVKAVLEDGAWETDDYEYWIKVPKGYFLGGQVEEGSGNEDDPDVTITKWVSPETGIGFILNNSPEYTTTPVSGATLKSNKDELNTVTVTFPTNVKVEKPWDSDGEKAELYYCDPTGDKLDQRQLKGTYTTKTEGNVVTLTLTLADGVTTLPQAPKSKVQYYEVVIPQGMVQCTGTDGSWLGTNVAGSITNLKYEYVFDVTDVKLLDEDGEEITSLSTKDFTPATSGSAKDGSIFYLEFPCDITYTGTANSAAYMYMGTLATPQFATFYMSLEGTNTLKLQMKNPGTGTVTNHPELWYNADNYCFGIPQNVVAIDGAKLPATRFSLFEITDGVTSFSPVITGINNSANALPDYANKLVPTSEPLDGQKPTFYVQSTTAKEVKVPAADFGAIKPEVGVSYLQFTTPVTMGCNPATVGTAKISLVKVGQEEPIWSQTNTGKVNVGHLFKGRATRTLINTSLKGGEEATTTSWYFYNNFEENADGGYVYSVTKSMTAANVNKTSYYGSAYATPEFITEPGEYKYIIDEGFFISAVAGCPQVPSAYTEIPFTIVGDDMKVDYTISPKSGSEVSSLSTIVFEYPEDATIQMSEDVKINVCTFNSWINFNNYKTAGSGTPVATYPMTVSAEGNKVTLSLATPLTDVLPAPYLIQVPAKAWTIQVDGKAIANESVALEYSINKIAQGTMSPAPTIGEETIAATALQAPVYTSLMPVYDHGAVTTVGNLTLNKVSYEEVDGVKTLVKGAQVTTYTWTGSGNSAESQTECEFTAASTFDANDLASGLYAIYIPKDYFKYKGFTTSPQDQDFVFVYEVKGNVSTDFTRATPANYTTAWLSNGYKNLQTVGWEFGKEFKLNAESTDKVVLSRDGVKVAEAGVADVEIEEAMVWGDTTFPGIVTFHFPGDAAKFNVSGIYNVEVPAGFFTLNDQPVEAFYKAYNYSYNKRTPDFTYTLAPEAGEEEVSSLEQIEVTFSKCYDLMYQSGANPGKLTDPDGNVVYITYPKIVEKTSNSHSLVFTCGNANTAWKSGKYTFEILPNSVMLEDPAWDEEDGTGNFEGLKVEYTLDYVPPFNLIDHMTLANPTSYTANQANTNFMGMATGLGMIMLDVDVKSDQFTPGASPEFVTISYSATKDGEYTVLKTLNPNAEGQVFFMDGTAMGATTAAPATLVLNFIEDGDGSFDFSLVPNYQKVGYYHVVIPNGLFTVGGKDMIGCELDFTYGIKPIDLTYTLAPVDGSVIEDLQTLVAEGIKVTFPGASAIDATDGATLTLPDGTVLDAHLDFDGKWSMTNYVKFKFPGLKNALTPAEGETLDITGNYVFKVAAKAIAVDLGMFDEDTLKEGNSPEIVATYIVDSNSVFTGILLVGVEGADAYTVYTLDGKLVKANAKASDLRELENGLYIINGKKALLRK